MSIDLYVMPLWRFCAGDYTSPLAAFMEGSGGPPPKRVNVSTGQVTPAPHEHEVGFFERWRARREVARVRRAVRNANGRSVAWKDDGPCVHRSQAHALNPLLAYEAWLSCKDLMPAFEADVSKPWNSHPALRLRHEHGRQSLCPHLIAAAGSGVFLPCDFATPVVIRTVQIRKWTFTIMAGSSIRLAAELDRLNQSLKTPDPFVWEEHKSNPLVQVYEGYLEIRKAVELSVKHGLPMIYEW